jgi:predicted MPP superfamily phosphohydrolase
MLFEAQWLQLKRLELRIKDLAPDLYGTSILHVSDLHAGAFGPGGRAIEKFVAAARGLDPDLVLLTGDLTDKKKDLEPIIGLLGEVKARWGKFAVLGNHDHGLRKTVLQDLARRLTGHTPQTANLPDMSEVAATVARNRSLLQQADFELLDNECREVSMTEGLVQLCGIDDFQYHCGDLDAVARQLDSNAALRILLSHSPDAVSCISAGEYQLVLAGHTHGGQICLPAPKGKILLSSSGSEYGDGIYRVGATTMHVSRGVGTTLLPFRLLSRPEITLLKLQGE